MENPQLTLYLTVIAGSINPEIKIMAIMPSLVTSACYNSAVLIKMNS